MSNGSELPPGVHRFPDPRPGSGDNSDAPTTSRRTASPAGEPLFPEPGANSTRVRSGDQPSPVLRSTRVGRVLDELDPQATSQFPAIGKSGTRNEPFAPITGTTLALPVPLLERLLHRAYRWRTALGLGLAAVTTLAVVVAYQGSEPTDGSVIAAGASPDARSAFAAVTEFGDDPVASGPSTSLDGAQQVNSAVDGEPGDATPATTRPPASEQSTPTSAPDPAGPSTTSTEPAPSTSVIDGSTTSAVDETPPTTIDETTSSTIDPSSTVPTTTIPDATSTTVSSSVPDPSTTTSTTEIVPLRVEAEDGEILGTARVRNDHTGFSGTGFVGDIIREGSGVVLSVDSAGGDIPFQIRYSAGPDNGPAGHRTLSVLVNGVRITEARMQLTDSWNDWDLVVGTIALDAGSNEITLVWGSDDTGWVNIDYIVLN